jgi:hypothetical protein
MLGEYVGKVESNELLSPVAVLKHWKGVKVVQFSLTWHRRSTGASEGEGGAGIVTSRARKWAVWGV